MKETPKLVPLVVTQEEVKQLQQIRDRRLGGLHYKPAKTNFFKNIRSRYGISTKPGTRIKIETEKEDRLGIVQYCSNHKPVRVPEELTAAFKEQTPFYPGSQGDNNQQGSD